MKYRVPKIKKRMGIDELIVDANYTGENSENVCAEEGVRIVPTEVKERRLSPDELSLTDFHFEDNKIITCPAGHSPKQQIDKVEYGRHIAMVDRTQCSSCPCMEKCPVLCRKSFYSLR